MATTMDPIPATWIILQYGLLALSLLVLLVALGPRWLIQTASGRTIIWMQVLLWAVVAIIFLDLPAAQGIAVWFWTTLALLVMPGYKRGTDVKATMRAIREQMRRNGQDIQ